MDSENKVLLEPDEGKDPEDDDIFIFNDINEMCYDDTLMLAYCDFLKRYTLKIRGIKMINKFMCENKGNKSVFDLITPSDEAYAIFIFMNGYMYWKARRGVTPEARRGDGYVLPKKKWTQKSKNGYAECGISNEGIKVYNTLLRTMTKRRDNTLHWEGFMECWKTYSEEHGIAVYLKSATRKRKEAPVEDAMVEFVPQRMPGSVGLNGESIYAELFAWEDKSSAGGSSISSVTDNSIGENVAGDVPPVTPV